MASEDIQSKQIKMIMQASQIVVCDKPLNEICCELAEQICAAMEVDACILRRLHGDDLILLGQAGISLSHAAPRLYARQGLSDEMIKNRKPISIYDVAQSSVTAPFAKSASQDPAKFVFRSFAGAPMMISDKVIGVLGVYMKLEPRHFTELDLDHLQIIANYVAVAIENNRLFNEVREKNIELKKEVEQREQAERRLMHHAFHDGLTGIPNRYLFAEHLDHAIAQSIRGGLNFSILLLDLDRFKIVNESLGHDTGDKLLIAVAGALQQLLRPGDILARLGGDEFAILLEDINQRTDARVEVDKVHQILARPFIINEREVSTTVSFGIVYYDPSYKCAEDMLRDAELAMYHAKSLGAGKHCTFASEMRKNVQRLFDIESELKKAMEQGDIYLEFQPIMAIADKELKGFEALARWRHHGHGFINPMEFVSVAEATDRILELGEYILISACRQAVQWKSILPNNPPLYVSVNVSGRQIAQPSFPDTISRILSETKLTPSQLCLELTETILLARPADTLTQLNRLHEMGVRIFIDDFGTGYSSLSYLDCLPVDMVKIDKSFVEQIHSGSGQKELIPAIVNLSHSLGYPVTAEGVETAPQLRYLQAFGVDYAQGFLISRSMPALKTEEFCRKMVLYPAMD